ncbi:MAG: hypothetical protein KDD19_02330 [Phaeodactylibacter sp.]|nr:hypothetical protein [Phaeodactylibacter sp.]MCB9048973.1 hypothetical protein [Lewinellaceae bacterium]
MGVLVLFMIAILAAGIFPLSLYLVRTIRGERPREGHTLDEEFTRPLSKDGAFEWWEAQRGPFNRSLLLAGIMAVLLYYGIIESGLGKYRFAAFEFSWWALFFQIVLYLIYMGIANLLYNAGMIVESMRKPLMAMDYRRRAYQLIFWSGMAAPFLFLLGLAFF